MSLRLPLSLAVVATAALGAHAYAGTPRTFDVVQVAPPDGFDVDDTSTDHLTFTQCAPGRCATIVVYAGADATGDLAADWKAQWHASVEHMMQPDATPDAVRGTMPGGVAVLAGSSTAKMADKDVYARFFVIDGGAKVASVLVVTNGADIYARYQDTVNAMLAGLKVTPTPPPAAKPGKPSTFKPVAPPDDPALTDPPTVDKKQLAGDWKRDSGTPGDKASAFYGDSYSLTSKGKIETKFTGKSGTETLKENDAGGYAYKDGRLLLLLNKRGTITFRVAGWNDDKDATTLLLLPDGFPATQGNQTLFGSSWVRAKPHHGKH
jgi:hypothetical protein